MAVISLPLLLTGMLLFVVSVSAYPGSTLLSDRQTMELYSQGTEYFHQAAELSESDPAAARDLYTRAALRFERIVEEGGIKNGKLYYNIGNIYFLLDDIGRAILNYRRAEQFIANDPNLVKNLAYARSIRQDKLEASEQEKIFETLFFFHYDLGIRTRVTLFAFFYASFWLFAGMKIFSRRPFTSWGLGITLLFSLIFGMSLFMEGHQAAYANEGVLLLPETVARQGDAESYQPSFGEPLHAGTEFMLREARGDWWQIELPDGRSAWIPAKSAELVKE